MSSQIKHTHSHQDEIELTKKQNGIEKLKIIPPPLHNYQYDEQDSVYSLSQPHYVTASHPSAGDNQQSTR